MSQPMQIGGAPRVSAETEIITNPYDGSRVGEVSVGNAEHMDEAIEAAVKAFEVTRRMPSHERRDILERAANEIEVRAEELAVLMTRESGKPIRFSRGEVTRAVLTLRLGAGEVSQPSGEVLPIDLEARAQGRLCLYTRVPLGPVAAISPFNFPLNLIVHKLAPAIALGAPSVLKPPPQCPLVALALGEILSEVGLPGGALSIIPCSPETAQRMVVDERMKVLSFTGSDRVGWELKRLAGRKKVLLELGGNAPCIVDEGTDLEACMQPILSGAWAHGGQVCIKVQRVLVHASLFDEFLERFVEGTRALACGDPMDEDTVVGPLIEPHHVERVLGWIHEARESGARMHCGGEARGQVVLPTILTDVDANQKVCKDEVFGPVTVVEPFGTFDEALALCNASRFGLQAGVFTSDIGRALRAFQELDYGGVMINDIPTFRIDSMPYGGSKDSGFGREGVRHAMDEMSEPRVLVMRGL